MNRKKFIRSSIGTIALATAGSFPGYSQRQEDSDQLDDQLVKDFVVAGHRDLSTLKEMLAEYPNLIYSKYDWGDGDFEEAIEGAGHVGNKEIANFLITRGARANLFVLTMLGKTDLVLPILEVYPKLLYAKGPHGFTLLHHAQVGGNNDLYEKLLAKGLKEMQIPIK